MKKHDDLKLENQICFPLYVCSKEIIRCYKPFLDEIDLTYTQYITMMVLWEKKFCTVTELGKQLYLDSGTLTPLLKKLESKGLLTRTRSKEDERNLNIALTEKGASLRNKAAHIPEKCASFFNLESSEKEILYKTLYKILLQLSDENK